MNASHLIEANVRAHTVDGYTSFPMVAAAHEATIRALVAELNTLKGIGATPQNGCHIVTKVLGDAEVLVEFEWEGGGGDGWNEPHYEASISIIQVLINGCWCDAEDVVPEKTLERWTVEIAEAQAEAADDYPDRDDSRDDYAADLACDKYEREIDARAAA